MDAFACPPDCGHCCTHLERPLPPGRAAEERAFRAILREHGVYHCADRPHVGLSLSNEEAERLRAEAQSRGMRLRLHPRTWLLESRRRVAVVLDWHMPYASCPFFEDYKCKAYEARPLVCRAYPVLLAAPFGLAPECPKVPIPREALRAELRARRAIDRAHATLDATAMDVLATPGARFSTGLAPREAAARLRRSRLVSPAAFQERVARTPATRSSR